MGGKKQLYMQMWVQAWVRVHVCVCLCPPPRPSFPSKSYTDAAPPSGSSFRLASPCDAINRSIYIAFHGWALPQYFRGPPVNWPLIIHRSLVHHIQDPSMHVHRPIWKHDQRLRFRVWHKVCFFCPVCAKIQQHNFFFFTSVCESKRVRDNKNWCMCMCICVYSVYILCETNLLAEEGDSYTLAFRSRCLHYWQYKTMGLRLAPNKSCILLFIKQVAAAIAQQKHDIKRFKIHTLTNCFNSLLLA